ncbi:phosphonate metabolism transcriptional regulator PhnF [Devosia sp. CN2-171]|jgi:GntR family phosphonate transport system transcriptional regulator|uniref:phosphonate metabolism transcriptional regulator PhnF n=1 Tax=Devosia sp. CN2-171 TaxID=3400909 RepID=UPI003BF7AB09
MTILSRTEVEPAGGVALWRQIADAIRLDIVGGKLETGDKLAGELPLAERFGVNRHTVRRAIAVLIEEGVLRAEHGRGTFVAEARRLSYPIGRRTRFSEGLAGQVRERRSQLLASRIERATSRLAQLLEVKPGTRLIRQETASFADGRPMARATGWLPEARFAGFDAAYLEAGSVTAALRRYGIDDYSRGSTRISARHATADEAQVLKLAPGSVVLVSDAVDLDADGVPIHAMLTRFPADRMELVV